MYAENMGFLSLLLDVVFPKDCIGCGAFGTYLCSTCFQTIHFNTTFLCPACMKEITHFGVHTRCKTHAAIDGLYAVSNYDGLIASLIGAVKYRFLFDMAALGGDILHWQGCKLGIWESFSRQTTAIVPVPIHWKKRWERGFNASQLYAKPLANKLGLYLLPDLLIKTKRTKAQAQLSRSERLTNIKGSFFTSVSDPLRLPKNVILIDDVATTGSTLQECAASLKKAGVKKVFAVVLAHGK